MPHVLAQDLRNAVLQAALEGKLTDNSTTDARVDFNSIQNIRSRLINSKKMKRVSINVSNDNYPFEIPDNWMWCKIGQLEEINLGFTYRPQYTEDGVYFLSVKDISSGKINFSNAKKVSRETYENAAYGSKPQKGDILFGRVGTMGKPQIVETDIPFCIFVSLGFFRDHTGLINKNFVMYWMQSKLFDQQVNENVKGAAQKNLNTGWLKNFWIPFPPIEEQARIVARVDELMAKIDEYEKIEKELSELQKAFPGNMKDAILQAAMQGKLTEQLSSDTDIRKYYEMVLSEVKIVSKKEKEVSFTSEEPFDIPSNWIWVKLNDLVGKEIRRGKSPKYAKDGKAMAFAQKCNSKYTGIRLDLALCLDDNSLSRYADHDKLQDLDVVINSTGGGTLGRIGLYKAEYNADNKAYYPDSHVTVIRAKKCVSSLYIFRCLQYYSPYLETLGEGSTNQTELKPDVLKGLYIPLPPIEEQQRIVDKLDQLLPLCESLEAMI